MSADETYRLIAVGCGSEQSYEMKRRQTGQKKRTNGIALMEDATAGRCAKWPPLTIAVDFPRPSYASSGCVKPDRVFVDRNLFRLFDKLERLFHHLSLTAIRVRCDWLRPLL